MFLLLGTVATDDGDAIILFLYTELTLISLFFFFAPWYCPSCLSEENKRLFEMRTSTSNIFTVSGSRKIGEERIQRFPPGRFSMLQC